MKTFLEDDFLLETRTAVDLYETYAARQPIIDFHCHLSPADIADDRRFQTLTQVWLDGDHYKWRAMRSDGVPERLITGAASDWERFEAWARTVPHTLRNPLYHWTHLELGFPFGVRDRRLGPETAREIYDHCNTLLAGDGFTAQGLLRQYRVEVVCTTDDPADDLEPHRRHAAGAATGAGTAKLSPSLVPTWRPDRALGIAHVAAWNAWVDRLGAAADVDIGDLTSFRDAIGRRHAFFHAQGCRSSDHGLDRMPAAPFTERETEAIFTKARGGARAVSLSAAEVETFRSALAYEFAVMDHSRGWVQQFHLGAMRNNSARGARLIGPDSGFDSIGDLPQAEAAARFFDRLDDEGKLARTVLYNLNPADNEVFATLIGSFQDGGGKMQLGAAWWFLDQLDGMRRQIDALSNMGLLSRFVGMLTDSRSFLSFSRHDYFRRLLCNILGDEVERGLLPSDRGLLGPLVEDVCYRNARAYFGFA